MEPRIQYAKTEDGVSIAYATRGRGPPLVFLPVGWEQFSLRWKMPAYSVFIERLGAGRQLVQYDRRGFGLSDRSVTDYSLETEVADLEAVLDALKLNSVALLGSMMSGPGSIAFAAAHPDRISHLVLYATFSKGADVMPAEQLDAFINLARSDWDMTARLFADSSTRETHPEEALQVAKDFRQSAAGVNVANCLASRMDVDHLVSKVQIPTLVLHRQDDGIVPLSAGQKLASQIPNAEFLPLEGVVHTPFLGDSQAVLDAIDEFLAEDEAAEPEPLPAKDVHTILFTDMQSSTALTQRLGDAKAQEVRRTHNDIVRSALSTNDGSEIKHTGDGIMASFTTASSALECAIAIQRGVAAHVEEHPDSPLGLYIGLNAGEPIAEERDLFGTSVDLAKRICDHAEPGQILVADVVRQLAAGKDFLFADLGDTELRGFEDPVKLWEVRWREQG